MAQKEFYEEIGESLIDLDEEKTLSLARKAINEEMDLVEVIEKGFGGGVRKLGKLWDEGEFFLPELMMGGQIVNKAIDMLIPHIEESDKDASPGKIILATIEGDVHSIGRTIVGTMLSANGYHVHDIGKDVPVEIIIEEAEKENADIIGVSALLTTTMPGQKTLVEKLKEKGIRKKYKVILGGAPVTADWVKACGADGYAENALDAVTLVNKIMDRV